VHTYKIKKRAGAKEGKEMERRVGAKEGRERRCIHVYMCMYIHV
jgi:hypothetical protein